MASRKGSLTTLLVIALAFFYMGSALAGDRTVPSVGIQGHLKVFIAGPEVECLPLSECKIPLVVRVAKVQSEKDGFRYDFAYYGLEQGSYDLRDALRRKDGTSINAVPAMLIEIESVLEPERLTPNKLESRAVVVPWSYRQGLLIGAVVWVLGFVFLIWSGKPEKTEVSAPVIVKKSLGDHLKPLVEAAMDGRISSEERATLERLLFSYWRKQLGLRDLEALEALREMRKHKEASRLLNKLEEWLHKPGPKDKVRLGEVLEPYLSVSMESLEDEDQSS